MAKQSVTPAMKKYLWRIRDACQKNPDGTCSRWDVGNPKYPMETKLVEAGYIELVHGAGFGSRGRYRWLSHGATALI